VLRGLGDNGVAGCGVGEWVLFVPLRLEVEALLELVEARRRPKVRRRKATRLALPGVDVIA